VAFHGVQMQQNKVRSGSYLGESFANRGDLRPGLGAACPLPLLPPLPRGVGASKPTALAFFEPLALANG
jgi:hypothetical protein